MKIVVTGGAGYIGAVLTGHLLAHGWEITVFDSLVYGGESLLGFFAHPRFRFLQGEVRHPESLAKAIASADAVVHLAAIVGEAACAIDEAAAWSVNYGGAESVLAEARKCGVPRLIFVSTCSNYGISDPGEIADENCPLRPISGYARAKVAAEQHVLANSGDVCALVLRLGTICGLSPRMRFDLLVSEMARSAVLGDPIRVFAPAAWRPFLHIADAAEAILKCLEAPGEIIRGKIYNVVGENCQKRHLAELVLKHYPATAIAITEKQADLRDYRASGERIRQELGYAARFTVEDAFLETAAAVAAGVFRDPRWPGHSAVPLGRAKVHGS
jgi:nucleoside-diphosphate-sugar epimerase